MRLAVIGTGYVGLVSGTCFAEIGHHVICVDNNPAKIDALLKGQIPIFEPDLDTLVASNHEAGRLQFTTDIQKAVSDADAVFIAVGTPPDAATGRADLQYVFAVCEEIAPHVKAGAVVVTKSTVPVGTGAKVKQALRRDDVYVASNPEFLREGAAIGDFIQPDRVVIGTDAKAAESVLAEIYQPLSSKGVPLFATNIETAEMIKYAANSFLATKVAFINEMADICEATGANVEDVATAMGLDARIGPKFLKPGPGMGGSCFPKDTRALVHISEDANAKSAIVSAVVEANEARKLRMAEKILAASNAPHLCVLGLAFKANTDDVRESPALTIIPELLQAGRQVTTFDPEGMAQAKQELPDGVTYAETLEEALKASDTVVILTEWDAFKNLPLTMDTLIDLRNLYDPETVSAEGITYVSVGRWASIPVTTLR